MGQHFCTLVMEIIVPLRATVKWVITDVLCSLDLFECRILSLPATIWLFSGVCNCSRTILLQRWPSYPTLISLSQILFANCSKLVFLQAWNNCTSAEFTLITLYILSSFSFLFCSNFSLEKTEREIGTIGDLSPMFTYRLPAFLAVLKPAVWHLYCSLFLTGLRFNQDMSLLLGVISHFTFLKARASLTRT